MNNIGLLLIIVSLWGLALYLFRKKEMHFFKFLTGSIGLFTILLMFFMHPLEKKLIECLTMTLNLISNKLELYEVYRKFSIIVIETKSGIVSMGINYECSGIIETLVFTSLCIFFPFGSVTRRSISLVLGNVFLFIANIVRILFIILIIKAFGANMFFLAHTLLARILFFGFTVLLYYIVFTSTQLRFQKVGNMNG